MTGFQQQRNRKIKRHDMAYFIDGLTVHQKWFPVFDYIDEPTDFAEPYLSGGNVITESSVPPLLAIPKAARLESRHKALPDIFQVRVTIAVNKRTKDIIENIEPNIHQFFKIDLFKNKKDLFDGDYYLLNVGQLIDSIIEEESALEIIVNPSGKRFGLRDSTKGEYRTLKKSEIIGKHLWRESLTKRNIYFSDELRELFLRNKINRIDDWFPAKEK